MNRTRVFSALLVLATLVSLLAWVIVAAVQSSPERVSDREARNSRVATGEAGHRSADAQDQHGIHGVVRTADGEPVSDAEVSLHRVDRSGRTVSGELITEMAALLKTKTSPEGVFHLPFEAPDRLVVVAHKEGLASASVFAMEDESVVLVLPDLVTCDVTVHDDLGQPIADAELRVFVRGRFLPPQSVATTGADGVAHLEVVPDGWVSIRASGFATTRAEMRGKGPVRVIMREGRRISGTIVSSAGAPLEGVTVGLRGDLETSDVRTDVEGRFAFAGVDASPNAEPWIIATLEGWVATEWPAAMPGQSGIRIVMEHPATVRGNVVDRDGNPAQGAWVWTSKHRTGPEGRFEISGLTSGRWALRAWMSHPDDPRVTLDGTASFELREGETLEGVSIVIGPSSWNSRVLVRVYDEMGAHIDGATVVISAQGLTVGSGITDGEGVALVRVYGAPGTEVTAAASKRTATGWKSGWSEDIVVSHAAPPFPVVPIEIGAPSSLRLHIVDPEGKELQRPTGRVTTAFPVRADGTYELPATETFVAVVRVPGCAQRTVSLPPPHHRSQDVTIRLASAARLTGRVVGIDGRARSRGVTVETHQRVGGDEIQRLEPDSDGRFEFSGLSAGPVHVRVYLTKEGSDTLVISRTAAVPSPTIDLGDMQIPQRIRQQGLILDEHAAPLEAAGVYCFDSGGWDLGEPTTSRSDGTFGVTMPDGLPLTILVRRRGYGTKLVTAVARADKPLEIALAPAGRVRVVVPDFVQGPWRVRVRIPGTNREWEPWVEDDQGHARVFGGLPAGRLELVFDTGLRERVYDVDVEPGVTLDCVIEDQGGPR